MSFFVFSIKNDKDGRIIAESQRHRAASDLSASEGPQRRRINASRHRGEGDALDENDREIAPVRPYLDAYQGG